MRWEALITRWQALIMRGQALIMRCHGLWSCTCICKLAWQVSFHWRLVIFLFNYPSTYLAVSFPSTGTAHQLTWQSPFLPLALPLPGSLLPLALPINLPGSLLPLATYLTVSFPSTGTALTWQSPSTGTAHQLTWQSPSTGTAHQQWRGFPSLRRWDVPRSLHRPAPHPGWTVLLCWDPPLWQTQLSQCWVNSHTGATGIMSRLNWGNPESFEIIGQLMYVNT